MIREARSRPRGVALVSMPWAISNRPSMALGVIKPQLAGAGIECEVLYPGIELACRVGFELYDVLSDLSLWPFLGEWLFSKAAFAPDAPGEGPPSVAAWLPSDVVAGRLRDLLGDDFAERLCALRERELPAFCERLAERLAGRAAIGFTCSINQLVPALAAARAVKRRDESVRIVLGGAQVEEEAGKEILRGCPWVDAVYEGEFEVAGVETMRWALGERDVPPAPYVSYRDRSGTLSLSTRVARLQDMDRSPMPDYDEFYRAVAGAKDPTGRTIRVGTLPFESSRGCWWGERRHCTFCGLDEALLPFRSKSPERVLDEVLRLADRYQQVALAAVDSIIDHRYLRTLLPRLKGLNLGLDLFYETKSNLRREDVRLYRQAGLNVVQPGIESLSSHVLGLMQKGVSALRNVYTLKLCRQYGVAPVYNILLGFPGETVADHLQQAEWVRRLHHLAPPAAACRFTLLRHSPMHADPEGFGLEHVRPADGYRFVFPPGTFDVEKIAFYFDYDRPSPPALSRAQKKLTRAVQRWKRRWRSGIRPPELLYRNAGEFVLVLDGRGTETPVQHVLRGISKEIVLACDDPITLAELRRRVGAPDELEAALEDLAEHGLVLREGNLVLGLAIPHSKAAQLPFVPPTIRAEELAGGRVAVPPASPQSVGATI